MLISAIQSGIKYVQKLETESHEAMTLADHSHYVR